MMSGLGVVERPTETGAQNLPFLGGEAIVLGLVAVAFIIWPDPIVAFTTALVPAIGPTLAAIFIGAFAIVSVLIALLAVAMRVRFGSSSS